MLFGAQLQWRRLARSLEAFHALPAVSSETPHSIPVLTVPRIERQRNGTA
jgi:hypothetical protein